MKFYLNVLLLSITTFLFSGCINSSFDLNHNENLKTTTIILDDKSYVLVNSEKIRDDKNVANGSIRIAGSIIESYTSQDVDCKNIQYRELQRLMDTRRYYLTSAKEDVYKDNNNKCTTEKINNIYYHDCFNYNAITNDIPGVRGIIQKKYLIISDKKCFHKLKGFAKDEKTIQE